MFCIISVIYSDLINQTIKKNSKILFQTSLYPDWVTDSISSWKSHFRLSLNWSQHFCPWSNLLPFFNWDWASKYKVSMLEKFSFKNILFKIFLSPVRPIQQYSWVFYSIYYNGFQDRKTIFKLMTLFERGNLFPRALFSADVDQLIFTGASQTKLAYAFNRKAPSYMSIFNVGR